METSRSIRFAGFSILMIPTVGIFAAILFGIATGGTVEVPAVFPALGAFVLLTFPISLALAFVFPNFKELRIAAAINAIPLIAVIFVASLFWLGGYNG